MGYINIYVSKNANIYVKNEQLYLQNEDKSDNYPLEDISSIMIENLYTTLSTYSLSKFVEYEILIYICDKNHLPAGVVLPFCSHFHSLSQYNFQKELSKPLEKQLWQSIVKNKIKNQNEVLNICGGEDTLKELYQSVTSGDSTNNEAKASLIYFKELFGKGFIRRNENVVNAFLNYGYSIIRGFVARSIVSHGLMPFLGINHHNQFNSFNLADDLIEPFRPVIDLFVKIYLSEEMEMTSQIKKHLFSIINIDVEVDGNKQPLDYAIELFVQSYIKSLKENKNNLKEIKIYALEVHKYE